MQPLIADLMTPFPLKVPVSAPLTPCARMMDHLGIRHLVVVDDDGKQVGMLTDAAVYQRGALDAHGGFWTFDAADADLTAGNLAERFEVEIHVDGPAVAALSRLARSHQDAIVVVNAIHEPVGIVTEHDVVALAQGLVPEDAIISAWSRRKPITVHPKESGKVAYDLMLENGIRHVVLVDGGAPVGVVSFRDLVSEDVTRGREISCKRIVDGRRVITIPDGTRARSAAALMCGEQIGCLPVVDAQGQLTAVVTRRDLLVLLARTLEDDSDAG